MNQPTSNLPDPPRRDLSGQQLGDYLILRRLGQGGMAEVYLAEQHSLQRQGAIKVLRPDLANHENYVQRFHNEARAAAALVHANIVQIYEVGCLDGLHFIAQEYVRGQTVKQLVGRVGPLEIPRVVSLLRQITAALNKAGQEQIVHRDIKPENILLMSSGEAKVADFGLARAIDPAQLDLTQVGLTMGTPLYMSPEQVEGRSLDQRSDLYSLGVTAFFMLVGRAPFEGDTPLSVAVQHLQNPPPPLNDFRPDVPAALDKIVTQLLAKKPADRYSSAAELLRDLRALQIDGADFHLPLEADALPDETVVDADGDLQATRELQALMQTQETLLVRRRNYWWLPLAAVGGVVLGAILAQITWSGSVLSLDADASVEVERRDTAEAQFMYALFNNTEAGWKSVEAYHGDNDPVNRHWVLRAQQKLADYYLERDDYAAAYDAFGQLAGDSEPEFHAIGLAGQAIIHDLRDETQLLAEKLSEVWESRDLLDSGLRGDLERIVQKRGIPTS